ncbi:ribonuclease P [Candidatus Parvarchaeota archaeon]|nr:ribonuclease P [Candidatus Parvarchaeota archaeon]
MAHGRRAKGNDLGRRAKNSYSKKPEKFRQIAAERIGILFEQAGKIYSYDPLLSDRYVFLARKIAMKFRIRLPAELKRKFCRHCHSFLMPGRNCRIRAHQGKMVYYCLNCKKHMRFPYIREQKEKRNRQRKLVLPPTCEHFRRNTTHRKGN